MNNNNTNLSSQFVGGLIAGGVNYYATEWLTHLNPVAGFVSGFTASFVFGCSNTKNLTVDFLIALIASAVLTKVACLFLGIGLSFGTAVVLTGLAIASSAVAGVIMTTVLRILNGR